VVTIGLESGVIVVIMMTFSKGFDKRLFGREKKRRIVRDYRGHVLRGKSG